MSRDTRIYLDVFREAELRKRIAISESPAGQTMVAKMPALIARTSELMSRRTQAAMPELMRRRMKAMLDPGASDPGAPRLDLERP